MTSWAVGVTTSPRDVSTLDWCIDSLARAGWADPLLLIDGDVEVPEYLRHLQSTTRSKPCGGWPNYYLALTELLMRCPDADAFMLVQDDAGFADSWNLRDYLEGMLWPGDTPSIVSLYCSENYTDSFDGWKTLDGTWVWGALALIFPRDIAMQIASDPFIFRHRWDDPHGGLAKIDSLIGQWAHQNGVSFWYPTPSLVQHVGITSSIWDDSEHDGPRKADWFAGDTIESYAVGSSFADFPDEDFPPLAVFRDKYEGRVERGRQRMRNARVAVCGLARDIRACLPRLQARASQLRRSFAEMKLVLVENDSVDGTKELLLDWQSGSDFVHVLSDELKIQRFAQARNADRATFLASCRNRYLDFVRRNIPDIDYLIVVDTDTRGGWSLDGIASTFGTDAWDFVGSCGLAREPLREGFKSRNWYYFDAWAHREAGSDEALPFGAQHLMQFQRGEPLVPVNSCFGGLGVYRWECLNGLQYDGPDCEHVILHQRMRAAGFDRLFMNPDQIVLY